MLIGIKDGITRTTVGLPQKFYYALIDGRLYRSQAKGKKCLFRSKGHLKLSIRDYSNLTSTISALVRTRCDFYQKYDYDFYKQVRDGIWNSFLENRIEIREIEIKA